MGLIENLLCVGVDIIKAPIKIVSDTFDGEDPRDSIEEVAEEIKDDIRRS